MQISCTHRLLPAPEVHLRHAAEAVEQVARISAKKLLFTPCCVESVHTWTTDAGSTIGDLVAELAGLEDAGDDVELYCRQIRCLLLPNVILELVMARAWRSVVVLSRWYGFVDSGDVHRGRRRLMAGGRAGHSVHLEERIFDEWPDAEWAVQVAWKQPEQLPEPRLSSDGLRQMADLVRQWAPIIEKHAQGVGLDCQREQHDRLISSVQWLEATASVLGQEAPLPCHRQKHGCRHSAETLLQCLRSALLLRRTSQLHRAISLGIEARWPRLFDQAVHDRKKRSAPRPSSAPSSRPTWLCCTGSALSTQILQHQCIASAGRIRQI